MGIEKLGNKIFQPQAFNIILISVAGFLAYGQFNGVKTVFVEKFEKIGEGIEQVGIIQEELEYMQNQLSTLVSKQDQFLTFIVDLSMITDKSNSEIISLIREVSKKQINVPLIERIEQDIKQLNEQLPHNNSETIKGSIGVKKK